MMPPRPLLRDTRGATLVEFALILPMLMVVLLGVLDVAHTQYTTALITGSLQKAGRDLTLEDAGSRQGAIDQMLVAAVQSVMPSAEVTLTKVSHFDYADIGKAEDFDDDNANGACDNNEVFEDSNQNGSWDQDRGKEGIGGARDAVVYTAHVEYPRVFPIDGFIGLDPVVRIEASTMLRNQPYDSQDRSIQTGNCS